MTTLSKPTLSADHLSRQVQQRLDAGQNVQALKLAQQLATTEAQALGRYYLLGVCLDRVGRHEEALEAYRQELRHHPRHPEAKARFEVLSKALTRPPTSRVPPEKRPWRTALPRQTLLEIQQSLHNYSYRGVPMQKDPFDCALYPMLVWKLRPRTIFEIGSKSGGSALWFADLLSNFQIEGHVYSLDIVQVETVRHPRVTFMEADGRALEQALRPDFLERLPRPWLVIEDADHAYETSIAVLHFFHPWLKADEYIVVEDGIISDLSGDAGASSGPHRALKQFLAEGPKAYEIDADYCDFFGSNVTWNTNGFLRKLPDVAVPAAPQVPVLPGDAVEPARAGAGDGAHLPSTDAAPSKRRLLNLGCGTHFHSGWTNLDIAPVDPGIIRHDLTARLPFEDASFDAVYHSHVLEHLPHAQALPFLRECRRVLAHAGLLRVVVPDLETIARLYLKCLEEAQIGDIEAAHRYDWMVLELLDQLVREQSGGEMLQFWRQEPMPAKEFVLQRMGQELTQYLARQETPSPLPSAGAVPEDDLPAIEPHGLRGLFKGLFRPSAANGRLSPVPCFRESGEVHKWMYDRYSLGQLLHEAGFIDITVCAANQSSIPEFSRYQLDLNADGSARKPDSLFLEARKPEKMVS